MNLDQCYIGDCIEGMRAMKAAGHQVQTLITSPPYFGLRDYGREGQVGLEDTPREYVARLVEVFREAWDLLADDGTVWLNLGDSYSNGGRSTRAADAKHGGRAMDTRPADGMKQKDLIGVPWRVAFALQADGWYLRQDIIWHKPNPMPESVRDRCTKAHEYVFLLTKSQRYYYDHEAIKEPADLKNNRESAGVRRTAPGSTDHGGPADGRRSYTTRNRRDVWTVTPKPYKGAHFAIFPESLIEPCILAGSAPGDIVFDPFMGSGTTAAVARRHGRNWLGCELNPEYAELQRERTQQPGLELIGGGA